MTLWNHFQHWLGERPSGQAAYGTVFRFDRDLADSLQRTAEAERRSPDDLVRELLARALDRRRAEAEALRLWNQLSPREKEVTALACQGLTNRQIAFQLYISAETVKTHVHNVVIKFGVSCKSDLRLVLQYCNFSSPDFSPRG
jgi:two-component system nitrate/nitrite response regulator NarL